MNLLDVRTSVLSQQKSISANVYKNSHLLFRTRIVPFMQQMEANVNNVELFVNDNFDIIGGQIGKYDNINGLHVIQF